MPLVCQRGAPPTRGFAHRAATIAPVAPAPAARRRCKTGRVTLLERASGQVASSALARAAAGARLTADDAEELLLAGEEDTERMLALASALRDAGLAASGRPGVLTYSRKVFIPLTTLCRDRCHYCIFVDTPGQLLTMRKPMFMTPEQVLSVARAGGRPRVQGGAVHARRPARGPLARGPRVARRARVRVDARLCRGDGAARDGRDRDARPPEPRRDVARRAAGTAARRRRRWA